MEYVLANVKILTKNNYTTCNNIKTEEKTMNRRKRWFFGFWRNQKVFDFFFLSLSLGFPAILKNLLNQNRSNALLLLILSSHILLQKGLVFYHPCRRRSVYDTSNSLLYVSTPTYNRRGGKRSCLFFFSQSGRSSIVIEDGKRLVLSGESEKMLADSVLLSCYVGFAASFVVAFACSYMRCASAELLVVELHLRDVLRS